MNFDDLAKNMTPDIYSRLRESIELGRWPNEVPLTKEQKALCLEAIIKYEVSNNLPVEQRTGYLGDDCETNPSPVTSNIQATNIQAKNNQAATIPTVSIPIDSDEIDSISDDTGTVQ